MSVKRTLLKTGPGRALRRAKNNVEWIYRVLTQEEARARSNIVTPEHRQQEFSFATYEDLVGDVRRWCAALPREFDAVLAIPRSGVVPAAMVALHFNCPLGEVGEFIRDRTLFTGGARTADREQGRRIRRILVVDDSCLMDKNLRKVQEKLSEITDYEFLYGAVYSTKEASRTSEFSLS
jgi:hypothetical protein